MVQDLIIKEIQNKDIHRKKKNTMAQGIEVSQFESFLKGFTKEISTDAALQVFILAVNIHKSMHNKNCP